MKKYHRPLVQTDAIRPNDAKSLAGGWGWFTHVERIERGGARSVVDAAVLDSDTLDRLCAKRGPVAGVPMDRPRIMGILNITPDSFSDGGEIERPDQALARAKEMKQQSADFLDVGGESTRPGARTIPEAEEIARVIPAIKAIHDLGVPISIDTRKGEVARAALEAGAALVNDVSALSFDDEMAKVVAAADVPICLMHAQGAPDTMQDNPTYGDVLLDVFDGLETSIAKAEAAGISRSKIIVDPGIGFGKTLEHNLELLRGVSLFHGLGCPLLLGVSRKRFIGTLTGADAAGDRDTGTLAVVQAAIMQGVQIHRVHDTFAARQAFLMIAALSGRRV